MSVSGVSVKTPGASALLITGFAVLYAGGSAVTGWLPSTGWVIQAVIHIGEVLAVVAVALSGVTGRGRVARAGLACAAVGQTVMVAAEVIWPHNPDLANPLFGLGPILTGAGLITAGVAIVRARAWAGPARFLPLILGLATILVLIPTMIATGGPPAPVALWTIAAWDLLWFTLCALLLRRDGVVHPSEPEAVGVTVR